MAALWDMGERRCKILSLNLLSSPDSSGKKRTKPPALPVIVGIAKFIHGKVVRRMKVLRKTRGSGLSGGQHSATVQSRGHPGRLLP